MRTQGRKARDSLDHPRANILGDFEASSAVGALPGGDDGNTAGAAITIFSLVPDIRGSVCWSAMGRGDAQLPVGMSSRCVSPKLQDIMRPSVLRIACYPLDAGHQILQRRSGCIPTAPTYAI